MKIKDELELTRHGCTPAQFAAYVRQMLKKHGIDYVEIDFDYWKRGNDINFDYSNDPSRPCKAERSVSKPYQMQTYIRNWNGSTYNMIMEFDFWDDKTGTGYFYFLNDIDYTEDTTNNTTTEEKEEEPMATTNNTTIIKTMNDALDAIISRPYANRSAWNRGLTVYAAELLEGLKEDLENGYFDADDLAAPRLVERELLNGASDWNQYSWGGCSLIYDRQIAERLCTKSELKITRNGDRNPNNREQWLDVQARALFQASRIVLDAIAQTVKA